MADLVVDDPGVWIDGEGVGVVGEGVLDPVSDPEVAVHRPHPDYLFRQSFCISQQAMLYTYKGVIIPPPPSFFFVIVTFLTNPHVCLLVGLQGC